jgi:hypothetical protein
LISVGSEVQILPGPPSVVGIQLSVIRRYFLMTEG